MFRKLLYAKDRGLQEDVKTRMGDRLKPYSATKMMIYVKGIGLTVKGNLCEKIVVSKTTTEDELEEW